MHNVFTSGRVFSALVSAVLVARLFAVVAMTFPKLRENFRISLSSSRFFVSFWGIFLFYTQSYTQLKIAKLFGRTLRQPLGEYTRDEMKQKSKNFNALVDELFAHTSSDTPNARKSLLKKQKTESMTAAENEHEALCGELSSRMSAVGVKRARLGMNLKTF